MVDKRWKRSDISTECVLSVYARPYKDRYPADEVLQAETGAPNKVVWAAMLREEEKGFIEYGCNLRGGWLTQEGESELLAQETSNG